MRYLDEINTKDISSESGIPEPIVNEMAIMNLIAMEIGLGTKHYNSNGNLLSSMKQVLETLWSCDEVTAVLYDERYPSIQNFMLSFEENK